jgi:subtilisin family serine protease
MGRWLLALVFLLLGAPLALAADSTVMLEASAPGGGRTRTMLEPGSAFVAPTIPGVHGPQTAPRISAQSGDVRAIVRLREQPAPVPGTRARSRAGLVDEHTRVAAEIARLSGPARRRSTSVRYEYWLAFNGFAVTLPAAALDQLRRHPDVASVDADVEVHASVDDSIAFVGAPDFWATHGGYQGAGQVIAIIDTGVDYTHPDLGGCVAVGGGCRVVGGYDFVNDDADPRDDNGHGTHVAAIAAGSGALNGVAPAADILAYKVLDGFGLGFSSTIIAALERSVDPDGDTDPSDHVAVVNLSIGGSAEDDPLALAVDGTTASGGVVAVAAGNSGGFFSVESPGVARTAITVGAVSDVGVPASFSSGGPTASDAIKPEIAAPGVGICAAKAAGTALGDDCLDSTHISLNGTSMATPHVAGAAALLRGIYSALTPADIKSLLVQSARPDSTEIMKVGAGTLSIPAAAALHSVIAPTTVSFGGSTTRTRSGPPAHRHDPQPRHCTPWSYDALRRRCR